MQIVSRAEAELNSSSVRFEPDITWTEVRNIICWATQTILVFRERKPPKTLQVPYKIVAKDIFKYMLFFFISEKIRFDFLYDSSA